MRKINILFVCTGNIFRSLSLSFKIRSPLLYVANLLAKPIVSASGFNTSDDSFINDRYRYESHINHD